MIMTWYCKIMTGCLFAFLSMEGFCATAPLVPPALIPQEHTDKLLAKYTPQETDQIQTDLTNITALCFGQRVPVPDNETPVYVGTAGGPGAGKSTILETYLHDHPETNFVYIDPDQRALKYMFSYIQTLNCYAISKASSHRDLLKTAYDKWRDGSNYIANTSLNKAWGQRYHIAHGTTATGAAIETFYKNLKAKGYKIVLLLCASSDENRQSAIAHRETEQGFCQSTDADFVNKGKIFLEKFPIYFQYADELILYWTSDFKTGSKAIAHFKKGGTLEVLSGREKEMAQFKTFYQTVMGKPYGT